MTSSSTPATHTYPPKAPEFHEPEDNTVDYWAYATSIILLVFSVPLICFPRLLLFLSEPSPSQEPRNALSPLESFLSLHTGIWLVSTAMGVIINAPSISPVPTPTTATSSRHPLLLTTSLISLLTSLLAYNDRKVGPLGSIFSVGYLIIGIWGLWSVIFADSANYSIKTGADKHTSSFLFKNKASASEQKKKWRQSGGRL